MSILKLSICQYYLYLFLEPRIMESRNKDRTFPIHWPREKEEGFLPKNAVPTVKQNVGQ